MTRFLPGSPSRAPSALVLAGLASASLLSVACGESDPVLDRGAALFDTCAPCHGADGAGKADLAAPAIAGASEWYVKAQLAAFQESRRGYHYQDAEGLRMRPMTRALDPTNGEIDAVAAYVASLPLADPPATGFGDAEAGEEQYALLCAACHGRDGRGMRNLNAPSLLHLSDWYMTSALKKYRAGIRGATPGDAAGATMRAPVVAMSDPQIEDVVAYVMTMRRLPRKLETASAQPSGPPPVDVDPAVLPEGVTAGMVEEGQSIFHGAGICYTCHVEGGTGGPLAPDLTDDAWLNIDGEYESIVDLVVTGVPQPLEHPGTMQPRAGMPLTDDQVRAVAAYVYILSR